MKLELGFRAETEEEARTAARQWAANEPNVESVEIVSVTPKTGFRVAVADPDFFRWVVVLDLTLRSDYIQESLAL